MGQGLQRILRIYGRTKVNDVVWVWDYAKEKPVLEKDMTKDMMRASDIAKAEIMRKQIEEDANAE